MKLYKLIPLVLSFVLLITVLFTGCGEEKSSDADKTKETAAETTAVIETTAETTAVLETTAESGTVEKDPDGNVITKDSDGNVICVEDKNGDPIDTNEYLSSHSWVENSGSSSGGDASDNIVVYLPDGHKVTKDKTGTVISVEDKDGNPVDAGEYLASLEPEEIEIIKPDTSEEKTGSDSNQNDKAGSDDTKKNNSDSNSGDKNDSGANDSRNKNDVNETETVNDQNDVIEGEIPVIVATLPQGKDLENLPVLD